MLECVTLNKIKTNILFAIIVTFLSAIAWIGTLNQTIEGEGYYYFSPTNSVNFGGNFANLFSNYDNFPRILTVILEKIAHGEMFIYMFAVFVTILLVNLFYYFLVRQITNNSLAAILAAVYAGINYASNFQFYARGHFQWYLQRVPQMLVLFPSFYLLIKFADSSRYKYYLGSLILFIISIIMTHYTSMLLPLFCSVLLVWGLHNIKHPRKMITYFLLMVPFVLINYMFATRTSLAPEVIRPNQTFFQFLGQFGDIFSKVNYQLVVNTIPFAILKPSISHIKNISDLVQQLVPFVYLFYATCFIYIYKKNRKLFKISITFFLGLLGFFFLTVYVNRTNLYGEVFQGRYFYIPAFYIGFILSVFITTLLNKIPSVLKTVIIGGIVFSLFVLNTQLIHQQIKDSQYFFTINTKMLAFLSEKKATLPSNAIVVVPNPPLPGAEDFLKKYYSKGDTRFFYLDSKWLEMIPSETATEQIFVYNYEKVPNGSKDNIVILDESNKYRNLWQLRKKH